MTFGGGLGPVTVSVQSVSEQGVLGRPAIAEGIQPIVSVEAVKRGAEAPATYSLSGIRLPHPRRGINISKGKKFINH